MNQNQEKQAAAESANTKRNAQGAKASMIDAIRVIASFLIIWIHVPRSEMLGPTTIVGRFAVPFFVFAAVYFAATGGWKRSTSPVFAYVLARFRRIYLPFLIWTCVYLAFKLVKSKISPDQPNDFPGLEVLLTGSAYHLWFLPFVFFATVGAFLFTRMVSPEKAATHYWFALATTSLLVSLLPFELFGAVDATLYACQTLPAAIGALAFACFMQGRKSSADVPRYTMPIVLSAFTFAMVALLAIGRQIALENIAGAALFIAAYSARSVTAPSWSRLLAPYAFGIYLCHMLFIKVAESCAGKLGLAVTAWLDLLIFAVAAIGSVLACLGYDKLRNRIAMSRIAFPLTAQRLPSSGS